MEVTLKNGFCELTMDEMQVMDGGATVGATVAGTLGIALICWSPVGAVVGSGAVAAGMILVGAGAIVNMIQS